MKKFGKSQPVKRLEDARFTTGLGRYVDDIAPEQSLFAYVFRSPVAHAEIVGLDVSVAAEAEGVRLVLTVADFETAGIDISMAASLVKNRNGSTGAAPLRSVLAKSRVRFVGEPVAVVVADTLAQAKLASELILFDYEDLDPHVDPVAGGAEIHPEAPDNIAFDFGLGDETATDAAIAEAAHVIKLRVGDNRIIANAMEPRGCYAEWDGSRLHFCFNGQGVWGMKTQLAKKFKLAEDDVRVTNPDVGGGFGMKAFSYPEHFVVAYSAKTLGQPVRWMSDRSEAMQSDNAGRDLVSDCTMAFDSDHKITAYKVETLANMGAYNSGFAQAIQTQLFSRVLTGTYDIRTAFLGVKGIYTNTTQVDAYRGAGRPEAIYAIERTMDHAARALGIDPWELRRKNFVSSEQFPYATVADEIYDVGDFHGLLDRAAEVSDLAGFAARKVAAKDRGKLLGHGLCFYIEAILGDPSEGSTVEFAEDGRVKLYVGTQSNGQGHETVYAQFLADHSGVDVGLIDIIQGDSDLIKSGGGTGGSRSATVQNSATLETVTAMIEAFSGFLAEEYNLDPEDVSFDDEQFRLKGRNEAPSVLEVADLVRAAGKPELLAFHKQIHLAARSYPYGAHMCEVEIDPDTGTVELTKYSVVDDFGNLLNPMLVEGQIHGGVVQGAGQALCERVVYDETGQLLTASFMDYAMPRAADFPPIVFESRPVPSVNNALGMKGCGEAGTVGAMAAVANAVQDAVWDLGHKVVDMPFTPDRMWALLNKT